MSGTVGRVGGSSGAGAGNGGSDDDNGLNGGGIRISPLKIILLVLAGLVIAAAVVVGLFLYVKGSLGFGGREKDKTAKPWSLHRTTSASLTCRCCRSRKQPRKRHRHCRKRSPPPNRLPSPRRHQTRNRKIPGRP